MIILSWCYAVIPNRAVLISFSCLSHLTLICNVINVILCCLFILGTCNWVVWNCRDLNGFDMYILKFSIFLRKSYSIYWDSSRAGKNNSLLLIFFFESKIFQSDIYKGKPLVFGISFSWKSQTTWSNVLMFSRHLSVWHTIFLIELLSQV